MTERSDLIGTAVIAGLLCIAVCAFWFGAVATPAPDPPDRATLGRLVSSMYDPPTNAIEAALVKGDGQLFAGQATDPLVRRPEMVRGGPAEQAYRYQRPAYGWLGWAASAGQRDAVAIALMGVTVAATVLLTLTVVLWCGSAGVDPRWSLLVLLLPGVWINLTWIGPETLGTALVLYGLFLVRARRADGEPVPWPAVACFAAAGLCKETLLLIPFVLMLLELWHRRIADAARAATAAVPYAVWVLFLRYRIGAWPLAKVDGGLSAVPFGGLLDVVESWHRVEWIVIVATLAFATAALLVGRASGLAPYIVAHLALMAVLGAQVWSRYPDFARVLLPLNVLSLVAVLTSGLLGRSGASAIDAGASSPSRASNVGATARSGTGSA